MYRKSLYVYNGWMGEWPPIRPLSRETCQQHSPAKQCGGGFFFLLAALTALEPADSFSSQTAGQGKTVRRGYLH
jgi:hypothetical protein